MLLREKLVDNKSVMVPIEKVYKANAREILLFLGFLVKF